MLWILALIACSSSPPLAGPVFVRGGVVLPEGEGRPLGDGRVLIERPWQAGEVVSIGGQDHVAPVVAECLPLFHVPLGDVSRLVAMGGEGPDTALAFSPDGAWLAVGDYTGQVLVVDAWTGAVRARKRLGESMIKQVAWSPEGDQLYAAEQSPDAFVHQLAPDTLASLGRIRLADDVETSAPPPGDDLYGVYTLPAAYALHVLPDGDLIVAATHGWDAGEERKNRARVLRLGPDLTRRAAWPEDRAADAVFRSLHVGERVAVPIGRSATGPAPADLPIGGVQLLDLALQPLGDVRIPALQPWFDQPFIWEALAFGPDGALAVGLGDGRIVVDRQDGAAMTVPLGAPVLAGDVPIVASVGTLAWPADLLTLTARTNIPWGAASPELRPPQAHPAENQLTALSIGDEVRTRWTWRGPHVLQGLTVSPDRTEAVVGAGARLTDRRQDLFGALIFDLTGDATGSERLRAWCPTQGPVFFRHAVSADGRVAVAEFPFDHGEGIQGAYRVTVFR